LADEKWVKGFGAQHPWCFDLSHENAKIGGAEDSDLGMNMMHLYFEKCKKYY
jgi:hypothetical protein